MVLIDIFVDAIWPHASAGRVVIRSRQECVDVVGIELVHAARVDIPVVETVTPLPKRCSTPTAACMLRGAFRFGAMA